MTSPHHPTRWPPLSGVRYVESSYFLWLVYELAWELRDNNCPAGDFSVAVAEVFAEFDRLVDEDPEYFQQEQFARFDDFEEHVRQRIWRLSTNERARFLKSPLAEVFALYLLEGWSCPQIAEHLHCDVDQVWNWITEGLDILCQPPEEPPVWPPRNVKEYLCSREFARLLRREARQLRQERMLPEDLSRSIAEVFAEMDSRVSDNPGFFTTERFPHRHAFAEYLRERLCARIPGDTITKLSHGYETVFLAYFNDGKDWAEIAKLNATWNVELVWALFIAALDQIRKPSNYPLV